MHRIAESSPCLDLDPQPRYLRSRIDVCEYRVRVTPDQLAEHRRVFGELLSANADAADIDRASTETRRIGELFVFSARLPHRFLPAFLRALGYEL